MISREHLLPEPGNLHLALPDDLDLHSWLDLGRRLARAERSAMWHIGDWSRIGQARFGERYKQAVEATGLAYQTLRDAAWVAGAFEPSRRRDKLTWSHHKEVAGLEPGVADRLLDEAEAEGWTRAQLRSAARRVKSAPEVEGQTCTVDDLHGLVESGRRFGCIYADPPWLYEKAAGRGAAADHYAGMAVEDICALPVAQLAAERAHVHLWVTASFQQEAMRVLKAWGFEYRSQFVWCKPQLGTGNYWRLAHEVLLLGVRGDLTFQDRSLRSWETFDRGLHSAKPEEVRRMVERASPGPRLELFGRAPAEGWTVWGDQVARELLEVGDDAAR